MAVAGSGGWIPSNRMAVRGGRLEVIGGYTQNKPKSVVDDLENATALLLDGKSAQVDMRYPFQSELRQWLVAWGLLDEVWG